MKSLCAAALAAQMLSCGSWAMAQSIVGESCQVYRPVYETVYEDRQVTAYRIETETVVEERPVVSYRPVWETEMRERRYTVARPVAETSNREERYRVQRPVWETGAGRQPQRVRGAPAAISASRRSTASSTVTRSITPGRSIFVVHGRSPGSRPSSRRAASA